MTATRVEVQEYDEEVMTYRPVRNMAAEIEALQYEAEAWKAVCEVNSKTFEEWKATIPMVALKRVFLPEKPRGLNIPSYTEAWNIIKDWVEDNSDVPGGTDAG